MANRKEWEMDDEELRRASHNPRSLATAAARKALEWAQDQCFASKNVYASDVLDVIRKELTDD